MAKKFFVGAEAGCIGHTENGYPIHNYMIVRVVDDSADDMFFQLRKKNGIIGDSGEWEEIIPTTRCSVSSDDTQYDEPIYRYNGEIVPEERLIPAYECVDITSIVSAIELYDMKHSEKSPYFSTKCLQIFDGRQLNGRKKVDRPIIEAVKAAMNG